MAIVFDWYENPNASSEEEEAALHPRIFMNGKVDTETLCYRIHDYSSLTVGDVKNVKEVFSINESPKMTDKLRLISM